VGSVRVALQERQLHVDAGLVDAEPEETLRRLRAGVETSYVWTIGLYVRRPIWWDGLKDERRYQVSVSYRPETHDYRVERRLDGRLLGTQSMRAAEAAAQALTTLSALPCFVMGDHLFGKPLVVKVGCTTDVSVTLGVVPRTRTAAQGLSSVFFWNGPPERP
jgi:hypothetical protein